MKRRDLFKLMAGAVVAPVAAPAVAETWVAFEPTGEPVVSALDSGFGTFSGSMRPADVNRVFRVLMAQLKDAHFN